MSERRKTEIIILHETVLQSWARDASTFALFAALISLGVFLESSAMQWVGAAMAFMVVCARASEIRRLSIAQARQYLDEIEARSK